MEFIHPAVVGIKCFSKTCPFQHCSFKTDLWLRIQFTFCFSLFLFLCWQLDSRHCVAVRAEMSFTFFTFTIVFLSSSSLSIFPVVALPIYRGGRVIRVWAVVFYPIHFYLCFPGLILQSHILLSNSTSPPHPALVVFEVGKNPIGFFVTSIEFLHPGIPTFHLHISGKHIIHFGLVIWLEWYLCMTSFTMQFGTIVTILSPGITEIGYLGMFCVCMCLCV